jgi:hypothetical protein
MQANCCKEGAMARIVTSTTLTNAEPATFRINVPEQGFDQSFRLDEIGKFFDAELSFFQTLSGPLSEATAWEGRTYQTQHIHQAISRDLSQWRHLAENGQLKGLEDYVELARNLQLVVGQGVIGRRIDGLLAAGKKADAKWTFFMFAPRWTSGPLDELLTPFRTGVVGHPMFRGYANVIDAAQAVAIAELARQRSEATSEKFQKFYEEKSALIERLEELFRKKLPIEAPADFWLDLANEKRRQWHIWLAVFVAAAVGPIFLTIHFWAAVSPELAKLTTAGNGWSLAGVAALTIPAVLYGWVLKNLSRILIQTMNLADDAGHRRALAITWLGLVAEKKLAPSDEDRVLVLNALFRPVPPHAQDDGPPAGLFELIRARGN